MRYYKCPSTVDGKKPIDMAEELRAEIMVLEHLLEKGEGEGLSLELPSYLKSA